MRNLPCYDAFGNDMPWSVCGNMVYRLPDGDVVTGGGVLEWCYDEQDAMDLMEMMKKDPDFFNLSIRKEA